MSILAERVEFVIGVDTHKQSHVAAVVSAACLNNVVNLRSAFSREIGELSSRNAKKVGKNRNSDKQPYGFASYKLLKGFSSGTRRTLLNPAFSQSSRTFAS